MKEYSSKITLTRNSRGVYCIDPSMGCSSGLELDKKGCFSECYAAKSAKLYGYDFSKTILRKFENKSHYNEIISAINNIKMPFIRMGCSGDPSENWEHTVNICELINKGTRTNQHYLFKYGYNKGVNIVIITKHWNRLSLSQLDRLSRLNVTLNTSVSVIDDNLFNLIDENERINNYLKSIIRIVSFDFNLDNEKGIAYNEIQNYVFNNFKVIDTVFRCSKNNPLVKSGIIKVKKTKFLGKKITASKVNKKTYLGKCSTCLEMCGINL